jgi:hypothetical protein
LIDVGTGLTVWYFVVFLTVPTSMKNDKIPQPGQFQNPIEKHQNTTVRPVPTSMKNNKNHTVRTVPIEKQQNTFFYWNCSDSVVFCCFPWMLELF